MTPSTPVALILAAGRGERYEGDTPKQFLSLHGRPVVVHSLEQHLTMGHHVVLVIAREHRRKVTSILATHLEGREIHIVTGGDSRRASVLAGIEAVPWTTHPDAPIVLRNAASPNTPTDLIAGCIAGLDSHDGMQAFVRSNETTIIRSRGSLERMIAREATGFTADPTVYRRAMIDAIADEMRSGGRGETTLDIARRIGADIGLIESPPSNLKLTQPGDLERLVAVMVAAPVPAADAGSVS